MKLFTSRYAQIGLALIVAVLLIAGISSSAAAAGPVYHTVQYGQTLYSIAQHYGTSVWAISCANGLYNPNYVYAGQVLAIPQGGWGGDGCKPAYKPVHDYGNNCGCDDGYQKQVDYRKDCCQNGGYQPKPEYGNNCCQDGGYQPKPEYGNNCGCDGGYQPEHAKWQPQPGPKLGCYYTVRWGDGLYRIALKYGVSWTLLAQANDLHNGNYIYAGQVLRVPCAW